MKKVNCLIADDEQLAREIIETYVNKIDHLNLVAICANGTEVYNVLKKESIDLMFMDIQMPHLDGIELLRTIQNPPPVVLITAHREFALEGYQLNVIDYLLKPISFERFLKAVRRYELLLGDGKRQMDREVLQVEPPKGFLYVRSDKKMVRVLLDELMYIEGLKDYVKLYTPTRSIITHQTLSYFEEKLSADRFIRIHRSFIISVDYLDAFSAAQVEIGDKIIPIGNTYSKEVLKRLESGI